MPLVLDADVKCYDGGRTVVSGADGRVVRLSDAGRAALQSLQRGTARSGPARRLGRRLVDAGIAHPRPQAATTKHDVTVVVPVRDRVAALGELLAVLGSRHPVVVVDDGSVDAAGIAAVCARHGARLQRRADSGGPAAARNTALATVTTELVAFIDSDCVPETGWIARLAPHFQDPCVAAVAPRIRPRATRDRASFWQRYAAARSPLDLGPREGGVEPGRRIAYVPTAAMLVRRDALAGGFDEALRYGEDVDAVWRLHDAGGRIRYDPAVTVAHDEPSGWRPLLTRRLRYGTSAAPLSSRHPGRLAPLVLRPWSAAAIAAVLAGRPRVGLAVLALHAGKVARRLGDHGVPRSRAVGWTAVATVRAATATGRAATMLAGPALAGAAVRPRLRRPALALLLLAPLAEWVARRPPLDPVRWTLACIADDAAYGAGVWIGCVRERTLRPLLPR